MAAWLLSASPAVADTFKPTRFDDPTPGKCKPDDCSLREATLKANRHAGTDTIRLRAGTYKREIADDPAAPDGRSGDLDLTDEAKVVGAGAEDTAVNAAERDRVFELHGTGLSYKLRGLTVRYGNTSSPISGGVGAGVLANNPEGSLTLTRAVIKQNLAGGYRGGGVFSNGAELTITRSTVSGNGAGAGGGVYVYGGGNSSIRASTVSGNTTDITDTADGGGVAADASGGPTTLELVNSTVAGNEARRHGGGAYATAGATIILDNSTVAYNQANWRNDSGGSGGGAYRSGTAGTFALGDSLIAGNTVGTGGSGRECAGAFSAASLVVQLQPGTACSISGTIAEPSDALIGPLAENGGPTRTVALLDGSAAIGFTDECPTRDQRGFRRPLADCDSGAFERPPPIGP